jgi:crotonobetaine/carnitine-CoA ligase
VERDDDGVLNRLLPAQAERRPDDPWIHCDGKTWTFGAVAERVERFAAGWAEIGVGPGTRVALLLENSADYVFLVLALIRLGALHTPLNTAFRGSYLRGILATLRPEVLVVGDLFLDGALAALPGSGVNRLVTVGCDPAALTGARELDGIGSTAAEQLAAAAGPAPSVDVTPGAPASVFITSGTTGRSKGVLLSHACWYAGIEVTSTGRDVRPDDVFYLCTPMFHAAAWTLNLWTSLRVGAPVVLDRWFSVEGFWPTVRRYGVTQVCTLGPMHHWLWSQARRADDDDNPARVWTAVPMPADLWLPFTERFGLQAVVSMYGQTEVMPATMGDACRPAKPGSSGRPQPGLELRIVDDAGAPLPTGETGEIVIRPRRPHAMFEGYLGDPGSGAGPDGWFHTGDLGRVDDDGDLFFVDRKADHIRRRGHNVSSAEIEAAVGSHPAVADVAAYAVAAAEAEDEVMITVVPRPGTPLDVAELLRFSADRLPPYALPRYVDTAGGLPRTATGKVEKYRLRERGVTPTTVDTGAGHHGP